MTPSERLKELLISLGGELLTCGLKLSFAVAAVDPLDSW
jgi:hypothetical protein